MRSPLPVALEKVRVNKDIGSRPTDRGESLHKIPSRLPSTRLQLVERIRIRKGQLAMLTWPVGLLGFADHTNGCGHQGCNQHLV